MFAMARSGIIFTTTPGFMALMGLVTAVAAAGSSVGYAVTWHYCIGVVEVEGTQPLAC